MKVSTVLIPVLAATLACGNISCKKSQAQNQQQYDPYGQYANPYGTTPTTQGYAAQGDYATVTPTTDPYSAYQQQSAYSEPSYSYQEPAPAPSYSSASSGGGSYTVRSGDNLYRIGLNHGVSVNRLKSANGLADDTIHPGDVLTIP